LYYLGTILFGIEVAIMLPMKHFAPAPEFRPVSPLKKEAPVTEAKPAMPASGNRRESQRQRVLVGGLIVTRNGTQSWDCSVRDLSETGAKIRVAPGQVIPEHCYFIQLKDGIAYEANVEWLNVPEIGLKFLNSHQLRNSTDPKYEHLRQLWMGKRMRS
jgi:hypothetical protein